MLATCVQLCLFQILPEKGERLPALSSAAPWGYSITCSPLLCLPAFLLLSLIQLGWRMEQIPLNIVGSSIIYYGRIVSFMRSLWKRSTLKLLMVLWFYFCEDSAKFCGKVTLNYLPLILSAHSDSSSSRTEKRTTLESSLKLLYSFVWNILYIGTYTRWHSIPVVEKVLSIGRNTCSCSSHSLFEVAWSKTLYFSAKEIFCHAPFEIRILFYIRQNHHPGDLSIIIRSGWYRYQRYTPYRYRYYVGRRWTPSLVAVVLKNRTYCV